jgi:hypothetical protein
LSFDVSIACILIAWTQGAKLVVADLNGTPNLNGIEAYRARYDAAFAQFPQNKAELLNRMVVGNTVIDHEKVIRGPEGPVFDVAAIYTFRGDKIARYLIYIDNGPLFA